MVMILHKFIIWSCFKTVVSDNILGQRLNIKIHFNMLPWTECNTIFHIFPLNFFTVEIKIRFFLFSLSKIFHIEFHCTFKSIGYSYFMVSFISIALFSIGFLIFHHCPRFRDKSSSAESSNKRYVITNPPADFNLLPSDQVDKILTKDKFFQ